MPLSFIQERLLSKYTVSVTFTSVTFLSVLPSYVMPMPLMVAAAPGLSMSGVPSKSVMYSFLAENYKQELTDLLNQVQEEGAEMQNTYDSETDHGTIIDQQEAWNKKIEDLLRQQTCF